MTSVAEARLGDVAEFIRGINFKPDDVVPVGTEGSVVCMRTKNVQEELDCGDVWAVPKKFIRRDNQMMMEGDILVSSANSWNLVGKCSWIPKLDWPASFGGFVSVLRANPVSAVPRYIYWWFASGRTQALLRSFGQKTTNISNLNIERCLNLKLPLPALPEQNRIAAMLDKADALRAKRRETLAQLDSLAQSIFIKMFGDPSQAKAGENFDLLGGYLRFLTSGGRGWAEYYSEIGSRFVRSFDVQMNHIGEEDKVFVTAPNNAEAKRTRVRTGDVLLTITGSLIGRVATAPAELDGAYISQHVAILRVNTEVFVPEFLSYFLSLESGGQRQIAKSQYGQTKPGLNFEQIRAFRVPIPSLEHQHQFLGRVGRIEALRRTQLASLDELGKLFASLQHRAFRGEL